MKPQYICTAMAVACSALLNIVIVDTLNGQDIRQYNNLDQYQYFPRLPEGPENPPPLPDIARKATGSPKVLIEELKGLVFVDDPSKVVKGDDLEVEGVDIDGASDLLILHTQEFHGIAQQYIGRPVSMLSLNQLIREIVIYYRQQGLPVVDVSIPEQDITSGVVQLVVREARVGEVRVEGPCFFNPCVLVRQVCISQGDRIYESVLQEDLRWLYRNPFRTVDLELTPGHYPGYTDVVFHVEDQVPIRVYAGYEDTGNQATGLERTIYGVNWYNALWKDDQLSYQYTSSATQGRVAAHSMIYSTALPNRDIVTFYGNYGTLVVPPILNPFNNRAKFWQTSYRWDRELCPWGSWEHGIQAGFDYKNTNSALDFAGAFVFETDVDIIQFEWGYNGRSYDCWGSTHFAMEVFYSPGGWSAKNTDTEYRKINPFADSTYCYGRGYLERRFWLPRCWEVIGRVTGQASTTNLMSPETLGMGGWNSIRGYDQYTYAGDYGYFFNVELWTPPWRCLLGDDELRFLAFYDVGTGWAHTPVVGLPAEETLQGTGVGMRYRMVPYVEVRADYGFQLRNPVGLPQPDSRFHVGAVFSY